MPEDFSPYDFLARLLHYWKLVILMMIVGGLTAYLFHLTQPPLYESQAAITFAFNVNRFGHLTEAEEDHAMGAAGYIIATTPIPEFVYDQAHQQGYDIEMYPVSKSVFVERKSYRWVIRVRNPEANAAAFIANTWAQRAYQELLTASGHAERADALLKFMQSQESCLERMSVTDPTTAQCSLAGLADLQKELQTTGVEYYNERSMGRGFLPYLIFNPPSHADPASQPGQFGQNTLILVGILTGLLLAIFAVAADLPLTLAKRIRNAPAGAEPRF